MRLPNPTLVCVGLIAFCVMFSCSSIVSAGSWDYGAKLNFAEIYSDNLGLSADSIATEDFVTQAGIGLSAFREDDRATIGFLYDLEHYVYLENSDFNNTAHQMSASADTTLVRDLLFVEASAQFGQRIVDPQQIGSLDNFIVTSNRTDAFTAEVSPTLTRRIGASTEFSLVYSYGVVRLLDDDVNGNPLDDATRHQVAFRIGSVQGRGGIGWEGRYDAERIEYDILLGEQEFESASVELNYGVTGSTVLFVVGGVESDITQDPRTAALDASFWRSGVRWAGANSSFEGSYGERFFGKTVAVTWGREARSLNAQISYQEGPTTVAQRLLGSPDVFDQDPFDNTLPALTPDLFLSEILDVRLDVSTLR